jgi:selT/selW/selH-like putative selenoprotein
MAEELKKEFGAEATLIPDRGGVFDVVADGKLVFSKFMAGRFPNPGEVSNKLKE